MPIKQFSKDFDNSIEKEKLLKCKISPTNLKTIQRLKRSDMKDIEASKRSREAKDGKYFEWDIWNFFYELEPYYINDPNHDFIFDLSEYYSDIKKHTNSINEKFLKDNDEDFRDVKISPQKTRQTDVVAIFERHIFIIECKHSGKSKGIKDLQKKIWDFLALKPFIEKRCEKIFGIPFNAVFIAASSNYTFDNQEASAYLDNQEIIIFDEKRRNYIQEVLDESKSPEFALIQFLGFFRSGYSDFNSIEISNTSKKGDKQYKKVPWKISSFTSESGKGKKNKVYTFSMFPEDMLKISTVAHQQFNNIFEAESMDANYYQRILTSTRLNKIKQHLETNNTPFANNILVSYRGDNSSLKFEEIDAIDSKSLKGNVPGILKFDACPGTFHVIDGQHRLFGYTSIENKAGGLREKHRIIVTAFQGLTVEEEADIFLEVNSNAKPIVPSLLMEIEWSAQAKTSSNLCNGLIFSLRSEAKSPLRNLINEAQKNNRKKLQPKNLKTSIINSESFGAKSLDKWYANGCARNLLPDIDIILFWSKDFSETITNYYSHYEQMIEIFYKYNKDRWKTDKGVIRNIFFGGILQVIDRITISAIEEWRAKNIDVSLKAYFVNTKNKNDQLKSEKKLADFRKEVTKLSEKKMKVLAKSFASESEERKDKILHKDFFNLGAGAIKLVTTFLVKEYLDKYSDLKRSGDEENYDRISNTLSAQEVKSLKSHLRKMEKEVAKHVKNHPKSVENEDEKVRAGKHFDRLKNISYTLLSRHLGQGFWRGLIMKHFYKKYDEPRNEGNELVSGNVWYNVLEKFNQHVNEYGDDAFEIEWNFVEGAIANLLQNPRKIIRADNYSWANRIGLLQYLWEIMLIPKQNTKDYEDYDWDSIINNEVDIDDKSIWNEKDKSKQHEIVKILNSFCWNQCTDYIRVFGKVRNFERHGELEADSKSPWKTHYKDFEYYEPLFIERLEELNEFVEMSTKKEETNQEDMNDD